VTGACQEDDPRQVWVAEIDSEIVDFITVHMYHDRKLVEIVNNAVSTAHHHKGVSTKMYEFVLEKIKQAGMEETKHTLRLDVRTIRSVSQARFPPASTTSSFRPYVGMNS